MSVFEPNSRHLQEVLIFCFHLKKTVAEALRVLSSNDLEVRILGFLRVKAEKFQFCSMSAVGIMLQNR